MTVHKVRRTEPTVFAIHYDLTRASALEILREFPGSVLSSGSRTLKSSVRLRINDSPDLSYIWVYQGEWVVFTRRYPEVVEDHVRVISDEEFHDQYTVI